MYTGKKCKVIFCAFSGKAILLRCKSLTQPSEIFIADGLTMDPRHGKRAIRAADTSRNGQSERPRAPCGIYPLTALGQSLPRK